MDMSNPVVIKGNKYGIKLVLDNAISFVELKEHIINKFKESSGFFKNADMALEFEGRVITSGEEQEILDIISDNTSINVICIIDNNKETEEKYKYLVENRTATEKNIIEETDNTVVQNSESCAQSEVYKGTLRSGQQVESDQSLIILGDVNPGAKIISGGNVIVLGALKGIVYAGMNGNESSFVVALEMRPIQIKICDIIARCSDESTGTGSAPETKIAFIEDENIYIEPLTKEVLNDIKI